MWCLICQRARHKSDGGRVTASRFNGAGVLRPVQSEQKPEAAEPALTEKQLEALRMTQELAEKHGMQNVVSILREVLASGAKGG